MNNERQDYINELRACVVKLARILALKTDSLSQIDRDKIMTIVADHYDWQIKYISDGLQVILEKNED